MSNDPSSSLFYPLIAAPPHTDEEDGDTDDAAARIQYTHPKESRAALSPGTSGRNATPPDSGGAAGDPMAVTNPMAGREGPVAMDLDSPAPHVQSRKRGRE